MTLQIDQLHLTDAGLQAIQNADAGGVLIKPKQFQIGDYVGPAITQAQTALQGTQVVTDKVSYVEVLNNHVARFTLDIPESAGSHSGETMGEILLLDENSIPLAYAVLTPIKKFIGAGKRISILLKSSDANLTTIDVTMSEFGSIPTVPTVEDLPNPVLAQSNAVSVLDLVSTSDGETSPGLACRHGAGGSKWGFYGYDRLFEGTLGAGNVVSPMEIKKDEVVNGFNIVNGTNLIVQIISGTGAGEVRKFQLDSGSLKASGSGFSAIDDGSVIAIWRLVSSTGNASSCPWPPKGDNIPENYILKKGTVCPYWGPPGDTLPSNTRLYKRPSRLLINHVSMASDSSLLRYPLGELYPESNNFVSMSMSGIENHKQGFDIIDNVLEIPEFLANGVFLDFRVMTREPSSGSKLLVESVEYVGDGTTVEFDLPRSLNNAAYAWVYVNHIKQGLTSYTVNGDKLTFTEPPATGMSIELNVFYHEDEEGYSTDITSVQYKTIALSNIIELPLEPQSKDMVFITEQGLHVNKSQYSIVGNNVVFSSSIVPNRSIEVVIFNNVKSQGLITDDLPGVIVDAISTSKGIQLVRHNAPPINLPAPEFVIEAGSGMKVSGTYPMFRIESEIAAQIAKDKFQNFNNQEVSENNETITITKRVKFNGDVIILASSDFSAELGPGFNKPNGLERIQTVLGFKTPGQNEPEFGRGVNGSDERGFATSTVLSSDTIAYSGLSTTQSFDILRANHSAGFIDIVAKMRVVDANVSAYGSKLRIGLNIVIIPKLG